MRIYDVSFCMNTKFCIPSTNTCKSSTNTCASSTNTCTSSTNTCTSSAPPTNGSACDEVSSNSATMVTNIGMTFPGTVIANKPLSADGMNSLYGFNEIGVSSLNPCFGHACSNWLTICGNVKICKNLRVCGHTHLEDTSTNNLEVLGNLKVHGRTDLNDTSMNNLTVNGDLIVHGHTRVCDLSACNIDISQNLEVFGDTRLRDASAVKIQLQAFPPVADASSTIIDGRGIESTQRADALHRIYNSIPFFEDFGLEIKAPNIFIQTTDTGQSFDGRGVAIRLPAAHHTARFRILAPGQDYANFARYCFQVDGSGLTQSQNHWPFEDIKYDLGALSRRWRNLYVESVGHISDICSNEINTANLTVTNTTNLLGHTTFNDASGSNLSLSNNLWVNGNLSFNIANGIDLSLTGILDVAGAATLYDISAHCLTLAENLWVKKLSDFTGQLHFNDADGTNLVLTERMRSQIVRLEGSSGNAPPTRAGFIQGIDHFGIQTFYVDCSRANVVIGSDSAYPDIHGTLHITEGINDSILLEGKTNSPATGSRGKITIGTLGTNTLTTTIQGGANVVSGGIATGARSLECHGSIQCNGLLQITEGSWSGTSDNKISQLSLGGIIGYTPTSTNSNLTIFNNCFLVKF